jgi:hypothetical protein
MIHHTLIQEKLGDTENGRKKQGKVKWRELERIKVERRRENQEQKMKTKPQIERKGSDKQRKINMK